MTILGTMQKHEFPIHTFYSRTMQINSALRSMWSNIFCNVIYLTIIKTPHILVDLGTKFFSIYATMGIYWDKIQTWKEEWILCTDKIQCSVCVCGGMFPLDKSIPFYFYHSGFTFIIPNETNKQINKTKTKKRSRSRNTVFLKPVQFIVQNKMYIDYISYWW